MAIPTVLKGVIHGKTIELEEALGLPDGQEVNVTVEPMAPLQRGKLPPGEGIRRSAGAWADDPEGLEEYLKWVREQRKRGRPPIDP